MKQEDAQVPAADGAPVERGVGRPVSEGTDAGARCFRDGCNGCDECTDDWDGDDGPERDTTCKHCHGTGGDPWNDGITPCEHCDGEGYEWWN